MPAGINISYERALATAICSAGLFLLVPSASEAAITIGSDLSRAPGAVICSVNPCTFVQTAAAPGASKQLATPIDGVIVRWRLRKAAGATGATRLRVLRPRIGGQYKAIGSSAGSTPVTGTIVSATRLPVREGDTIGVDAGLNVFAPAAGADVQRWSPVLAEGATSAPTVTTGDYELLLNADVEADADGDGYGDETQDACPASPTIQAACPVFGLSLGAHDTTAPNVVLSAARTQDVDRLSVSLISNEAATTTVSGAVNVPGASRSLPLRTVKRSLRANVKTRLRVRIRKSALRRVKRALRRGKRLRAGLNITLLDAAGNVRASARAIKLRP